MFKRPNQFEVFSLEWDGKKILCGTLCSSFRCGRHIFFPSNQTQHLPQGPSELS